jgi:hypothetical protein
MFIQFTEKNGSEISGVSPTIRLTDNKQVDNPNRYYVQIGENNNIYAVEKSEYERLKRLLELGE